MLACGIRDFAGNRGEVRHGIRQFGDCLAREVDLFGSVASLELPADFLERMRFNASIAVDINNEKARSEFIIAPLLLELKFRLKGKFSLFTGVELDRRRPSLVGEYPLRDVVRVDVIRRRRLHERRFRGDVGRHHVLGHGLQQTVLVSEEAVDRWGLNACPP